jgi:hypothetical protein
MRPHVNQYKGAVVYACHLKLHRRQIGRIEVPGQSWQKKKKKKLKKTTKPHVKVKTLGMVAHVCHPSDLGGRDQEDCDLRPAKAKS